MNWKRFAAFLMCLTMLSGAACAQTEVITLTCAGDALLGCNEKVRPMAYAFDRYIEQYGYEYPFSQLQTLFANDDVTLVNLEVVLADEATEKAAKSRYIFRGTTDYAKILTAGSVEVVNLSNNHTMDYGQSGYDSTIAALKKEGIAYCGSTSGGSDTYIYEKNGIKIGFIGVLPGYWVNNKIHQADLISKFDGLKEAGCQVIVASLHCGKEYLAKHDDIHDKYERLCIKYGANLIIGTHPHVPQGVAVKDGVTHIYSLGNSSFGGNTGVDEKVSVIQAYVAQFKLTFEDGVYAGHQMTIWPIHISGTSPENNYQPVLVGGEEAQKVMKMIQRDTRFQLNPYADGEGAVQDFVAWTK